MNETLNYFDPLIKQWFIDKYGKPTDIQVKSWPEIASGNNVLITAPTGSGKTLTAFLWAINQLITGKWHGGKTRVLYISPLKALNNDVRINLINPLDELTEYFKKNNRQVPEIRVFTRSGDTPYSERQKMIRRPPEIFITTPESLNLVLTSKNQRKILNGLTTVILDEIHSVLNTKRGTHLITAIDRLVLECGEFQRISLSATVKPLNIVADFTGGYIRTGKPGSAVIKREVKVIRSNDKKLYEIKVCFPENARANMIDDSWIPVIINDLKEIINKNKSTLIFSNSRRSTEKITRFINENEEVEIAYSHHGALSKELRLTVEEKLKNGDLKAIVSTNTLELGIDIGDLDCVVMVQAPFSISSGIQRLGRAGHRVGEKSIGFIYPLFGLDFIDSAVAAKSIITHDIEEIKPVNCPLDVLSQVILSMTISCKWDIEDLFDFLRTSYPYKDLSRKNYDLVLEMLEGKYADSKIRELRSRVYIDKIDNTIEAKQGQSLNIYLSGGTIPDRGYYDIRIKENNSKIGELDEEFVWERSIGDVFSLGTQLWKIVKVTHNDVVVNPTNEALNIIPFWRADDLSRDFHFSLKIMDFLENCENHLKNNVLKDQLKDQLLNEYFMDTFAADELINYLILQKDATKTELPHRHNILIEHYDDPFNTVDRKQIIIHTFWGGKLNKPFGIALSVKWEELYGYALEIMPGNNCIAVTLPHEFNPMDILTLVKPGNIEDLLRKGLEKTGFFGAKFRQNSGRALLLPKANFKNRTPLWLNRLRSKKLLTSIMKYKDFPILLETWRECINDEFDIENLKIMLDEVIAGKINIQETITGEPSHFADSLIWHQTNKYMYEDDTLNDGLPSNLSNELIRDFIESNKLQLKIPGEIIQILDKKLKRTEQGYSPGSVEELIDWVKERILIPCNEWDELLTAVYRDAEDFKFSDRIIKRLVNIKLPGAELESVCAIENLPYILECLDVSLEELDYSVIKNDIGYNNEILEDIEKSILKIFSKYNKLKHESEKKEDINLLASWLAYYGPVTKDVINDIFGFSNARLDILLEKLIENDWIVINKNNDMPEICDRENFEILLRIFRKHRQPAFQAYDIDYLQLFLSCYQEVGNNDNNIEALENSLDRLFGYPAVAGLWEEYIFPVRMEKYYTSWFDSLFNTTGLTWYGCAKQKISFAFLDDLELFHDKIKDIAELDEVFPGKTGRFSFFSLEQHSNLSSGDLTKLLWKNVWNGVITNDSFETIRNGIMNNYSPDLISDNKKLTRRSGFNRWKSSRPMSGSWFRLDLSSDDQDIIKNTELIKDRIRQLFRRYGIIFRELLAYESQELQWKNVFKVLRLMELSGEVLTGYFFKDIPGVQFISNEAFRFLKKGFDESKIFWINACDPVSLCGVKNDKLKEKYPARLQSTVVVFHGKNIVLISRKNCKSIEIFVEPGNPFLLEYFKFFKILITRQFNPVGKIFIKEINNSFCLDTGYVDVFKEFGFKTSYKGLELWKYQA